MIGAWFVLNILLMVLLGDDAQVDAGFSLFGDIANLEAR
jgi:hypothetical protein